MIVADFSRLRVEVLVGLVVGLSRGPELFAAVANSSDATSAAMVLTAMRFAIPADLRIILLAPLGSLALLDRQVQAVLNKRLSRLTLWERQELLDDLCKLLARLKESDAVSAPASSEPPAKRGQAGSAAMLIGGDNASSTGAFANVVPIFPGNDMGVRGRLPSEPPQLVEHSGFLWRRTRRIPVPPEFLQLAEMATGLDRLDRWRAPRVEN